MIPPLFAHQEKAIQIGKKQNLALFHDMGVGKTRTAIELIKHHGGKALVLAPLSILESAWAADIRKFSDMKSINLHDNRKGIDRDAEIYLINYDSSRVMFNKLAEKKFTTLVVDESSALKNFKSQRTQMALAFAGFTLRGSRFRADHIIPWRYCLTGTPAPNSSLEYFPQLKVVTGPGNKCFNDNYYAWRNKYFRNIFAGKMTQAQRWELKRTLDDGSDARIALMSAMIPYVDVVRQEDAIDLPEKTEEIRLVNLSKEEQEHYDTMERDLVLQFGDEQVLAVNALSEILKLRQITSGFLYGSEGTHQIGKSKMDALLEVLDQMGGNQVIIWADFLEEIESISKSIPDNRVIRGGCQDRNQIISDFQNGKFQYLITNPQCCGHGLSFVNCSRCVYYSINYSFETHIQSMKRIYRVGQSKACLYVYLLASGTIDELIYKAVCHKGDIANETLAWLRAKRVGMPNVKTA